MKIYEIPKNNRRVQLCVCGAKTQTFKTSDRKYRTRLALTWIGIVGLAISMVAGAALLSSGEALGIKGVLIGLLVAAYSVYLYIFTRKLRREGHALNCVMRRLVIEQTRY